MYVFLFYNVTNKFYLKCETLCGLPYVLRQILNILALIDVFLLFLNNVIQSMRIGLCIKLEVPFLCLNKDVCMDFISQVFFSFFIIIFFFVRILPFYL